MTTTFGFVGTKAVTISKIQTELQLSLIRSEIMLSSSPTSVAEVGVAAKHKFQGR
jgi:hypothetical protein